MKAYESHGAASRKLLSSAPEDVSLWVLYDMPALRTWVKGRLALLGDAAHPFLPCKTTPSAHQKSALIFFDLLLDLGQGGAMAIKDAASLACLFPSGTPATEVPERLKLYDSIRRERAHFIQNETRKNGKEATGKSRALLPCCDIMRPCRISGLKH